VPEYIQISFGKQWRHLANDNDTSTTTSFELVIISYIISANLFALIFHFLLINDVRMTTFTHQLLSRKTSTPEV